MIKKLPYISKPSEIPNNIYHNGEEYIEYISSSILKLMMTSPKWMRYCQLHPEDNRISTEADLKGSVYHSMLASRANCGDLTEFEKEYAVFQAPVNKTTGKAYGYDSQKFKEALIMFREENQNKEVCSQTEIVLAKAMIKELTSGNDLISKDINFLLKYGKAEISHFVEYQGGLFKYRTDLKTSTKIVDWKSCRHGMASVEGFSKQIFKMGYHISAAFYQFMDYNATGKWKNFYWVAQEKEPPYDFNIIDASNWTWKINDDGSVEANLGAQIVIKLIEQYLICKDNDSYPGYAIFTQPDYRGHRISVCDIPGYVQKQTFNFYN